MLGDPSVLSGCKSTFMEFIKNSAALGCCLWTPPPSPHSPGPSAPSSLKGPRTKSLTQASAKLQLSIRRGDLHFTLFPPNSLAGRARAAGRFVCFSSFCFVWFLKLSARLGSQRSFEPLPPSLPGSALCPERTAGATDCVHWPLAPSGFWMRQATGIGGQEGKLMSVFPAAPARLGPTAEATAPRGSWFLQPDPRGRPLPVSHLWEPACCWHLRASPALMIPSNLATALQTVLSLNLFWAHLCSPPFKFISGYPKAQPL